MFSSTTNQKNQQVENDILGEKVNRLSTPHQ
jgi:hypothetical protein